MVANDNPPTSWFYDVLMGSHLMRRLRRGYIRPMAERFDAGMLRRFPFVASPKPHVRRKFLSWIVPVVLLAALGRLASRTALAAARRGLSTLGGGVCWAFAP